MSQYRQRKKQKSIKTKLKQRKYRKKTSVWRNQTFRFVLWSAILALLLCYLFLFSPIFAIKDIKISGLGENKADLNEAVYGLAQKEMTRPFLKFFKYNSFFLLNTNSIKEKIKQGFPIIDEVKIRKKPLSTLVIDLKERKGEAILCSPELVCYFVDKTGVIFQETSRDIALPIIVASDGTSYSLGQKILAQEWVAYIAAVFNFFQNNLKIPVEHFITDKSSNRLNIKTSEDWEVYFSFENDAQDSLLKLGLLIEKNLPFDKRKNLQYIDMRFSKVYYK